MLFNRPNSLLVFGTGLIAGTGRLRRNPSVQKMWGQVKLARTVSA